MNYIFLKTSTDPIKVGDLTIRGIYTTGYPEHTFYDFNGKKQFTDTVHGLRALLPMLIMDAPERNNDDWCLWKKSWSEVLNDMIPSAIPFKDNQQVYEYLKSKGITPESEGLYEFDREVEIERICVCCTTMPGIRHHGNYCETCDRYSEKKVAIIKPPQQESEEEYLNKLSFDYALHHSDAPDKETPNWIQADFKAGWNAAKEYFKIERRKDKRNFMRIFICILVTISIYGTFALFNANSDPFEWNLLSRWIAGFVIGHYWYYNLDDIYDNL